MRQQISVIRIIKVGSIYRFLQTHPAGIIGIRNRSTGLSLPGQLSAVLPGVVPGSVAGHIPNRIAEDCLTII